MTLSEKEHQKQIDELKKAKKEGGTEALLKKFIEQENKRLKPKDKEEKKEEKGKGR